MKDTIYNSRIHFELSIFTRIQFEFAIFFANSLFVSRIHFQFTNYLAMHYLFRKSLLIRYFFSRINIEFTIYFAISLWVHYFFCESCQIPKFRICIADSLSIHFRFREFLLNWLSLSRIQFEFLFLREYTFKSIWIHYLFRANLLWIHYLFRKFTFNALSISWIHFHFHFKFTIFFAKITFN